MPRMAACFPHGGRDSREWARTPAITRNQPPYQKTSSAGLIGGRVHVVGDGGEDGTQKRGGLSAAPFDARRAVWPTSVIHSSNRRRNRSSMRLVNDPPEPLGRLARGPPDGGLALSLAPARGPVVATTTPANIIDETDHADNQERVILGVERHTRDEHRQTDQEQPRAFEATTGRWCAQVATTHTGRELRVLGVERALDLVEHALLMLGEWHPSLLACRRSGP